MATGHGNTSSHLDLNTHLRDSHFANSRSLLFCTTLLCKSFVYDSKPAKAKINFVLLKGRHFSSIEEIGIGFKIPNLLALRRKHHWRSHNQVSWYSRGITDEGRWKIKTCLEFEDKRP